MSAVIALVLLRLALGCHFLYEGVWKINHREEFERGPWKIRADEEFSAEPFLTQAKGPLAGFFYAMTPDIDGRQRLHVVADSKGGKSVDSGEITDRWAQMQKDFVRFYQPKDAADANATATHAELARAAKDTCDKFCEQLDAYLRKNTDDIAAYFGSLDRFENDKEAKQDAPFQKQRRWDRMMELRRQADVWIKNIEGQERAYKNSLYALIDGEATQSLKDRGRRPYVWNPLRWDRMDQINFAVTFGLTAIGACLMLGFCTPLAALGGAGFMAFVVATQPAFPGIYPPDSPIVGHALLINKDFIEMLALLVIACTPVGRWGGLDLFVCRWVPFCRCRREEKITP